jgi:hypothetical protein
MKAIIILLFFVGLFFIMNGIYEQKLKATESNKQIEYKFIPRTYYEEQLLSGVGDVTTKMASMFDGAGPWFDQTVGSGLDILKNDLKN